MPTIEVTVSDEAFEELTKMVEDKEMEPNFDTVEAAAADILEYHLCGPDDDELLEEGEDSRPDPTKGEDE